MHHSFAFLSKPRWHDLLVLKVFCASLFSKAWWRDFACNECFLCFMKGLEMTWTPDLEESQNMILPS